MSEKLTSLLKLCNNEMFDQIAEEILFCSHLVINGSNFKILEIEFYLNNSQHPDIFTHSSKYQKTNFHWYFHRSSEGEHSYKGGTYKGLDLTFGSETSHGGILLRSIMDEKTNEIIEGPCKVVDKILDVCKSNTIKDLVVERLKNNICANNPVLHIKQDVCRNMGNVFKSPRIGLTLKKKDNFDLRVQYISRLYRYVVYPSKISKGKKMVMAIAFNNLPNLDPNIFNCTQTKINQVKKETESMKITPIKYCDFSGIDLNDEKRLQLFFGTNIPKKSEKIKLKLKI